MKARKKNNKTRSKKQNRLVGWLSSKKVGLTWLVILGYLFYIFMVLIMRAPFLAEQYVENSIPEVVESHLTFYSDDRQSHYDVELVDDSTPGRIDVSYYSESNTLRVTIVNIKSLTIYARSMYNDECQDVFGFDPNKNSNYYKWFFIEKNHLNVNIESDNALDILKFIDVPKPYSVIVNSKTCTEGKEYRYISDEGVALSQINSGSTNVDIYFKAIEEKIKAPIALIKASKYLIQVDEEVELDGSESYDQNSDGKIINYLWDFGDGNFTNGIEKAKHQYRKPGVFGIILTVVNSNYLINHAYFNITVLETSELFIRGTVPDIRIIEDSTTFTLNLRKYEPPSTDQAAEYFWYMTGEDSTLYSISGENNSDDRILITPLKNQFGNDLVWLWLFDINDNLTYQALWINITPVNDRPTIFGIPDITIHYDVPYDFYYMPYVTDVDTPLEKLVLNSSDARYTKVSGLNVTYTYPKSMVGETEYVILTIWDGTAESSDVVAVWITDDWVPNLIIPLPDVYLDEGEIYYNYFDLDDYFMDPDNDTLFYSYGYTHVNVIINDDHTVDFHAPEDWNGEELTTFRATDPCGALIEDIIAVTVKPINDPPEIKNVPNLVVRYGQDYFFDVSPYIYDEENSLDELTLISSDPTNIKIAPQNHLSIIVNYPYRPDIPYTQTVKLTISDGINEGFQIITVYVKDNYPPILLKPFQELILYEDVPKNSVMNMYDYFEDNDSAMLYFRAIHTNMVQVDFHVNGSIDISNAPNWSGGEAITFRAEDPEQAFVEGKINIKVLPVNDPPIISEIPVQRFNISEKYKLDLITYISDIDNNITQLQIWIEDSDIDYEIHGANIMFFTTKSITTTLTLHVSDGQEEASQKVLVEVVGKKHKKPGFIFEFAILIMIILIMIIGIFGFVYRNYRGNYDITELFLIYHNGLLLLHLSNKDIDRDKTDADIISGMFTAVQDFVQDSFASNNVENEDWSLKKFEFKNNNILIDRGDFLYIAVIYTGSPGKKLGIQLKKARTEIENKYKKVLKKWSGKMDQLSGIEKIIHKHNIIINPKKHSKISEPQPMDDPTLNIDPDQAPQNTSEQAPMQNNYK